MSEIAEGYVLAGCDRNGTPDIDWDGKVHSSLADAEYELRAAHEAGCESYAVYRLVPAATPTPGETEGQAGSGDDDVVFEHGYLSTACEHELHDRCRLTCKFCSTACYCSCHGHPITPAPGKILPPTAAPPAAPVDDTATVLAGLREEMAALRWELDASDSVHDWKKAAGVEKAIALVEAAQQRLARGQGGGSDG